MTLHGMLAQLSDLRKRIETFIGRVFLHPAFGFFSSVVGILAGWLGSHFDNRIGTARFALTLDRSQIDFQVLSFWAATALFGICFSGTFWAQSASSARSNQGLQDANRELHDAIDKLRTVPPKGFLSFYERFATLSTAIRWNLDPSLPVDELKLAIRMQLDWIIKVVEKFDDHGVNVFYGANVMRHIGAGDSKFAANSAAYASRIKCVESGVPVSALAGVLDLELDLSVSSVTGTAPDSNLSPLCLPISLNGGAIDLDWLIAGAPLCFASGKITVYQNQEALIKHVADSPNFTPNVKNQLKEILSGQHLFVQALISIPLYDKARSKIGVLNIHKARADDFIAEKIALLAPLLGPMVNNLGNLVAELP
jgi:hypothetical protein